jgi:hypothetical protein
MQLPLYELCAHLQYLSASDVQRAHKYFPKARSRNCLNWHTSVRALRVGQKRPNACILGDVKAGYKTEHNFTECGVLNNFVAIAGILCWRHWVRLCGEGQGARLLQMVQLARRTDGSVQMSCCVVSYRVALRSQEGLQFTSGPERTSSDIFKAADWCWLSLYCKFVLWKRHTRAWKLFRTQNTKQACNCTRDTVGSTLPVTIAILIRDGDDKQTRLFVICVARSCEWCSCVQLPAACVQFTHTHSAVTSRTVSPHISCHAQVNTCLAILPLYKLLGSFCNYQNSYRPLGKFILKINILFT